MAPSGLSMGPSDGIVGYVFTTGQPLAVSDVAADPRFDRSAAQETGYVPRSILAVPLVDDGGTIGVLEVLDRRGDAGFGLHDIELASVFARQAAVAIRSSRVEREVGELLRATLARLADGGTGATVPTRRSTPPWRPRWPASTTATDSLWALADAVARARAAAPGEVALVIEILDALGRRAPRPTVPVPAMTAELPAWSEAFAAGRREAIGRHGPWGRADRAWAFGDGTGRGIRVAIVDSGRGGLAPGGRRTPRRERGGRT